ncbi:MAG: DNA topoisomerase IV subunit A [Spirochaetes bacterium]|nr:MAG: DNA topoisomerase IV subunit A [Spirochaetota bacterium]
MSYVNKLYDTNFLEYASYVIKDRAIPDIRDGLKPVQRRILHSLFQLDDGKFNKVANVVGHCMQYHPHGDQSIYSALVVLANKELFIEKQGNFGNILTGDPASAARYIECRLLPFARKVLYSPEVTEYIPSYDGRNREPVSFPAKIPVVLIQGAEGIAVGMSTRILPHNFNEVLGAVIASIKGEEFTIYPDFPGGGLLDASDYQDGLGKVLVRAKLDTSDPKRIVIREIPYGTTTESLIASIENAARKGKIKVGAITDFTTDRIEIEVKLPRNVHTSDMVDALFAFTDCEVSISVNLLVIKDNLPSIMSVSDVIAYHADHLLKVLKAELKVEEGHLKDKLHARTLERIFIEERIYKDIEEMTTQETVIQSVLDGFVPYKKEIKREVVRDDVERLLKIPIRRISLYDINKARREIEEINTMLKAVKARLKDLKGYAVSFLEEVVSSNGGLFPRKTELASFSKVDVREAARRDLDLYYDDQTGYIGTEVKTGKALFKVSSYDRILVMRKNGIYSVVNVPDRLFVDKGMLFCSLADKESLQPIIFTVLYQKRDTRYVYLKRFKVEKFIIDKSYPFIPEKSRVLRVTIKEEVDVVVTYKPKARLKILEDTTPLSNYLVKGLKANGVRLSTKEIKSVKFVKAKK